MLFPLPLRAALILYHIQNRLSSTFFKFFSKVFFCVALSCETALILYHFLFFLSSTFSKFFQKVFRDQLRSLSRQLNYYITFSFLCQALFKKFFSDRLCLPPGIDSAYSSSSFSLSKVKVIFSSLSPAVTRARQ